MEAQYIHITSFSTVNLNRGIQVSQATTNVFIVYFKIKYDSL